MVGLVGTGEVGVDFERQLNKEVFLGLGLAVAGSGDRGIGGVSGRRDGDRSSGKERVESAT
jgi:hypothetical protein